MDMIDEFIERKHGRLKVTYDVPELKEVLEETYGVMVYQEQVMQISNRVAGAERGPGRNLWRDGVPGTGHADFESRGRILAGRSGLAAARHGQEEARGNGQAARTIPRRREGEGSSTEEGRKDFRPDGEVRRLRIQ